MELWIGIMDLLQPSDRSLQEMLREMKDPLGATSNGMMPPPLSAIYTPKVRTGEWHIKARSSKEIVAPYVKGYSVLRVVPLRILPLRLR